MLFFLLACRLPKSAPNFTSSRRTAIIGTLLKWVDHADYMFIFAEQLEYVTLK